MEVSSRVGLVIPTRNAGGDFRRLLQQLQQQRCPLVRRIVMDSCSADGTQELAREYGFEVQVVPKGGFNHGLTRQQAFMSLKDDVDVVIFITQDVLLYDADSLMELVQALERQKDAGAAYGRQLPRENASVGARLQRGFNYPETGCVKALADRKSLGIKTAFLSNSFAAYRCRVLAEVGGFPEVPACEDMYVGARMLLAGYTVVYGAEARVYHSHDADLRADFRRYYDTGVFHKRQAWIRSAFGSSEKEGMRLLRYQMEEARAMGGCLAVYRLLKDNGVRYIAYCLGRLLG